MIISGSIRDSNVVHMIVDQTGNYRALFEINDLGAFVERFVLRVQRDEASAPDKDGRHH